jgi:hypothetical protein
VLSGIKEVLSVHFSDGSLLRATEDHRCLTSLGWLTLREGLERRAQFAGVGKREVPARPSEPLSAEELASEEWREIPGFPSNYEVSNLGRVRNWHNTRNHKLDEPLVKEDTLVDGYPAVSLSWNGKSRLFRSHKLVLRAFVGPGGDDEEARHLDGCRANPRLDNLAWGTSQENADDRMEQGGDQRLARRWVDVVSWEADGREEVYDLSVSGPYHNFVAGGVVVHNSVNEVSGRYSVLPMLFYTPPEDQLRAQSKVNKQGRDGESTFGDQLKEMAYRGWESQRKGTVEQYEWLNNHDFARELARIDLPLSTYTQWYWKIDLHNLLHFLSLRVDSHAQWEIQQFGKVMAGMLKRVAPLAYEAWIDYEVCGARLSRMEVDALRTLLRVGTDTQPFLTQSRVGQRVAKSALQSNAGGMTDREIEEFFALFPENPSAVPDFELDLSKAKTAEFFEAEAAAAAIGK